MNERKELEKLRSNISSETGIAVYSVMKDEELDMLLKVKPKTMKELEGLKGFPKGGARCTKWGKDIIGIFNGCGISTGVKKSSLF